MKSVSWPTVLVTIVIIAAVMKFAPGVFAAGGKGAHQLQHSQGG